jgi:hypothetical protein
VGAVIKMEQALKGVGVLDETEFQLRDQLKDVEKWRDGKARLMVFHDRPTIVLSDSKLEVWTSAAVLGRDFSTMLRSGRNDAVMLHTGGYSGGRPARSGFAAGGIASGT